MKLRQLRTLRLERNKLTTLPSLDKLTELRTLQVDGNQLTSMPSVKELLDLTTLSAEGNSLAHLPDGILSLKELAQVYLRGNPISPTEVNTLRGTGVSVEF